MSIKIKTFVLTLSIFISFHTIKSCSNVIVSGGASADGSPMIAYNADSSNLYGSLYHYSAQKHQQGSTRAIYDWDSGKYLGQIEEADETYNVVGNMNEYGLVIGETTYGGIETLQSQPGAIMDYGSLIYVTLQRAKTAREAIQTLGDLMAKYGYASEGESFSIADTEEAWVMEIIGKGKYELGSVWVAVRIPDGAVCAHANQARITTFSQYTYGVDVYYSSDVVSFARKIGLYSSDKKDADFSFSDIYDPVSFEGARMCEGRVWTFFTKVMGNDWAMQYEAYVKGEDLSNRMPLYVFPNNTFSSSGTNKLALSDVMAAMRNHYENTNLDMAGVQFSDVGASFSKTPVRTHPLTWNSGSSTYFNERPISTQQTGWNFISQSRKNMPRELSGLLWFGVDDSSTTVRFPVYSSSTQVSSAFGGKGAQDGVTPPFMTFDMSNAHTTFNLLANWVYTRWDLMYPEVHCEIIKRQANYEDAVKSIDALASSIYEEHGAEAAVKFVTNFSSLEGDALVKEWASFFGQLFVKYRDGYVYSEDLNMKSCGCNAGNGPYPQEWYDRIVEDTGDHYKVKEGVKNMLRYHSGLKPRSKLNILSRK